MYVKEVYSFDGAGRRDVTPVRIVTTNTAQVNGRWVDVIPVDAVDTWSVQDPQNGQWFDVLPVMVVDQDVVVINGRPTDVTLVRVVSGVLGLWPGFSLAMDFVNSRYRLGEGAAAEYASPAQIPGWSYVRTGADQIVRAPSGMWRFGPDVPPIVAGYGLDVAEAATNLWTGHSFPANAEQAAFALSSLNSSARQWVARADLPSEVRAALDAEDPRGIVPGIVRIVAAGGEAAGANIIVSLGDTGPKSLSLMAYVTGGPWGVCYSDNSFNGQGTVAVPGAGFQRVQNPNIAPASSGLNARFRSQFAAGVGWEAYIYAPQVEAGAFVTPIIPVAGAQATRGAAQARIDGVGGNLARPYTTVARGKGRVADGVSRILVQIDNGSNSGTERTQLSRGASNGAAVINGGGSNLTVAGGFAGALDMRFATQIRADGLDATVNGADASAATNTLGARNAITFGASRAGAIAWRGAVELVAIKTGPTTLSERQQWGA